MKHFIIYTIFALLIGCYPKPGKDLLTNISTLPSFRIISLDSSKCVNTDDIPTGKPILFMYFSPDCDICQQETEDIIQHLDELEHTDIYMIANESAEASRNFCQTFCLDTVKNIFIGTDYDYSFFKVYSPRGIPFLAIYDSNRNLKKIYREKTPASFIVKALHSHNKRYN